MAHHNGQDYEGFPCEATVFICTLQGDQVKIA